MAEVIHRENCSTFHLTYLNYDIDSHIKINNIFMKLGIIIGK